jgi:hypothetical protein
MQLMVKMIQAAYRSVKGAYPAGCFAYLQNNDPNRITELRATLEAAKRAYLDGDPGGLQTALRIYKTEHTKTFGRYLDAVVTIEEER